MSFDQLTGERRVGHLHGISVAPLLGALWMLLSRNAAPVRNVAGQRFRDQASYSDDPELDAAIKEEIADSRHTVAALSYGEIKRILRLYNVKPEWVLAADTKKKIVDLAIRSGIVDVPDQWTLDRLLKEKNEHALKSKTEAGCLSKSGVGATLDSPEASPEYKRWVEATNPKHGKTMG